jgi:hypothetical protein
MDIIIEIQLIWLPGKQLRGKNIINTGVSGIFAGIRNYNSTRYGISPNN